VSYGHRAVAALDDELGALAMSCGAPLTARPALLHDSFVKHWQQAKDGDLRRRLDAALDEADR